jgi:hypothetical protein
MSITEPDYDHLLGSNIEHVFNERDAIKRSKAIAEIYTADPVLYEPTDVVHGREEISQAVDRLLKRFGPDFAFVPIGRSVGHHGVAHLSWQAGPRNGPVAVTGADVAEIVDGRIARLWVLLNPSDEQSAT